MFEKLFSPIKIKDMELKNRIILPAMGTKFSGDGSEVTDKLIDYHVATCKGGSGLNIVEVQVFIHLQHQSVFFPLVKTSIFQV